MKGHQVSPRFGPSGILLPAVHYGKIRPIVMKTNGTRLFAVWILVGTWSCISPRAAVAVAPHEAALLMNVESTHSMQVARVYAEGRGIPERNWIGVAVPERFLAPVAEMSASDFTRYIWEPARELLEERGLTDQVLIWIYSVDFPLRVSGDPPLSLTGLTFLRNRWPDADEAKDGRYASPVYGGPDPFDGGIRPPAGFRYMRRNLAEGTMPLPAAMLGYTGEGGNTPQTVLRTLRTGHNADGTRPSGTVYFVKTPDIRSRVREPQFKPAARELARYGVRAEVVSEFPVGSERVMGLLAGMSDPRPREISGFLPGSFAEHLTSFSAVYEVRQQTKMTEWTEAGASASAGVVTEPRAYWTKFPNARFFVYYAAGGTYVESFYQSVRCPLQTVPIGDPLMRPYGPADMIDFETIPGDGKGMIGTSIRSARAGSYAAHEFWLNDRLISQGRGPAQLDLDALELEPGSYRLRVVALRQDRIGHSLWNETGIEIPEGKKNH